MACARVGRPPLPAAPDGTTPPLFSEGERSVVELYLAAIDAARESIYLENQFFAHAEVFAALDRALERGVRVVALVPRSPLAEVRRARADPRFAPLFERLGALGRHERFTLAGLVATDGPGRHRDVYVHAKAAIVDDAWATIGSANLERRSLERDAELNLACWDAAAAGALRRDLFAEHLGPTDDATTAEAFDRFARVARENAERLERGEPLHALAVALPSDRYGEAPTPSRAGRRGCCGGVRGREARS